MQDTYTSGGLTFSVGRNKCQKCGSIIGPNSIVRVLGPNPYGGSFLAHRDCYPAPKTAPVQAPVSVPAVVREAEQVVRAAQANERRCVRCGRPVTPATAMNASLGLSCPSCYDALSGDR